MSDKNVSALTKKPVVIGLIFVFLFAGMAVGYFGLQTVAPLRAGLSGPQSVVFLAPLTGALSSYGADSKAAAELAVSQVNSWLTKNLSESWTLKLVTVDTGTSANTALTDMQTEQGAGVQFFIGPMSSGEIKGLKSYADSNKLLVISPSSTSPALSLPNDYILRYCPDDFHQAPAIARLLKAANITNVVVTWRGDSWGDGLENSTKVDFQALGGTVKESVRYDPSTSSFTTQAATLDADVATVLGTVPAKNVGVLAISFEEIIAYMTAADSEPNLKKVNWFGSDGTAGLSGLGGATADVVAAPFAKAVNFSNTIASPGTGAIFNTVTQYVNATLGRVGDAYQYNTYDIVWTLALALEQVKQYDATKVLAALPSVVSRYFGASGWFQLNANGDRAFADYEIWTVVKPASAYVWLKTGLYQSTMDSITWSTTVYH